jgi:predicted metalloprotease with PDZ domain
MRELWQVCQAGPMSEADVARALAKVGGRSFARELRQWVHGTNDLPLRQLLTAHGVSVHDDPAQTAQWLGLRVAEGAHGIQVKNVLRGSACEAAGFAPGDEWIGIEAAGGQDEPGWRLHKLDELQQFTGTARRVVALVSRDQRLLRLPLRLPPPATTWRLAVRDPALMAAWLCHAPAPQP